MWPRLWPLRSITRPGKWTLKPAAAIADGAYDVTAEVSDGGKMMMAAVAPGKLLIDTVAPIVPTLTAPAVDAKWPYAITGSWQEVAGSGLAVKLADKTYTLGKDEALKSDGKGTFTFAPTIDLKPGKYDLNFTVNDAVGNITPWAAPGAIVIAEAVVEAKPVPAPAPVVLAAPTIATVSTDAVWPYAISGTWPEGDAKKLSIELAGNNYELGSKELISEGKGKFTFMPSVDLKPGKYDLGVNLVDAAANVSTTVIKDAITVAEAPVAPAPAPKPAPIVLVAPTVEKAVSDKDAPVVKGTWGAGTAKSLSVSLAGQTYNLGKDYALLSDASGHWTLKPAKPLVNGIYDVVAEVGDGAGATLKDATVGELEIKIPPPPPPPPEPIKLVAPTVESSVSDKDIPVVKGTWGAGVAKSLNVTLNGQTYNLGKDYALLSDASGHWTLKPATPLVNGIYDVVAEVGDGAGATLKDVTVGELEVRVPPPPPPPPKPAPAPVVKPAPAPMPEMKAPTVEASTSDSDHPVIKGTWNAGVAKTLSVYLDGIGYKLGTNFELLSNAAGAWTLKPTKPLVNGTYEVIAVEGNDEGKTLRDKSHDELTVNVAPPPPPPPASQPYDCEATLARISAVFPVRFEFNKDAVQGPFELSINQYAALMKDPRCLAVKLEVEGHADFIGSEKYNQGLSERRAANVIASLSKAGIDGARLSAKGFSEDKPLDPATNDTARAKNRRVEFTVLK
jgi:large repetitive protein